MGDFLRREQFQALSIETKREYFINSLIYVLSCIKENIISNEGLDLQAVIIEHQTLMFMPDADRVQIAHALLSRIKSDSVLAPTCRRMIEASTIFTFAEPYRGTEKYWEILEWFERGVEPESFQDKSKSFNDIIKEFRDEVISSNNPYGEALKDFPIINEAES